MTRAWRSLRAAVLGAIVVGVVLPALLVTWVADLAARRSQQPVVERTRDAVMALATAAITEPAWTLNQPGLLAAMEGILEESSVCAVEVLDLQPDAQAADLRRDRCDPARPVVQREVAVRYEGRTIARLRLRFDDSELDQLRAERRRDTLWLVALQVLFGGAVIAVLMSVRLLRPIEALKRQADGLALRRDEAAPAWSGNDELGQLGLHLSSVHAQVRGLIDELEHKHEALRQLALHDALTGLPNRTLLRELFGSAAAQARRDGATIALLFVDLDQFKAVNDSHGHAVGDALLQAVGQRLREVLRAADTLCRLGGDEFLVLMPGLADADAAQAAARVIARLCQPLSLSGLSEPLRVGASVGIARFPADAADFDALVQAADLAMYRCKQLGRGRHGFYNAELDAERRARQALEHELEQGIAAGQLRLHYQAVVDPQAGRVRGAEALVRWQHPTRGLLGPDAFIALAEDSGLVLALGNWVLETACVQLAAWHAEGRAVPWLSVNVSALQMRDPAFVPTLAALLARHRVPPRALTLELTETTLLADCDATQGALQALRAAGLRLAVDDFGCGYSSLATLKRLRPDYLKIDRSFVRDLPASADDGALVQAMFGMARALGVQVVAEGVETAAQRDWLLQRGDHLQQGWLWARAQPADAFEALLAPQAESAQPG